MEPRHATQNLSVTAVTSTTQLEALRHDWTALLRSTPGHCVFLTWEWMSTWWAHFCQGKRLFILTARDEGGRLVGIAPLKITRRAYRGLPFRQLEFVGYGPELSPDFLDIIATPERRGDVLGAFAEAIADARDAWDVLRLADMPADSLTFDWARDFAGTNRYRCSERDAYRCPYLLLPVSWDAYLASLSANMREQVRRRMKVLEQRHAGRLILVRDGSAVAAGMEALFRLHGERWNPRGVVGSFDRHAQNRQFHHHLAQGFMQSNWLRLYLLEAEGQIVAALYGYEYEGRFAYYQAGFDPRWAKQSVGSVLMGSIIKDCIARGVREFDFLRGDEDYKFKWTRSERKTRDILIWNKTLRGRLHLAQSRAVATVKRLPGALPLGRFANRVRAEASL